MFLLVGLAGVREAVQEPLQWGVGGRGLGQTLFSSQAEPEAGAGASLGTFPEKP